MRLQAMPLDALAPAGTMPIDGVLLGSTVIVVELGEHFDSHVRREDWSCSITSKWLYNPATFAIDAASQISHGRERTAGGDSAVDAAIPAGSAQNAPHVGICRNHRTETRDTHSWRSIPSTESVNEVIRSLIPLGLLHIEELLDEEVTALAGERYDHQRPYRHSAR